MKPILFIISLLLSASITIGQPKKFYSNVYDYSIVITDDFQKGTPVTPHCDLLFKDNSGSSVSIIVKNRDFRTKSPHDLSMPFFKKIFSNIDRGVEIFGEEKLFIEDNKVYTYSMFIKFPDNNAVLYYKYFVYYDDNYEYVITMASKKELYDYYNYVFNQFGRSFKLHVKGSH
ncbi:MAG: hypothetical protein EKK39_02100 [Sphingobacteriales bacterium]|nr:MAG: hypothetical protein EKK39_02100 [Sphingobacteriales bacterium]